MNNTKEQILQTSLQLFARDGYEAVSVSAIAGALGITKGALYRHFRSKRDIFDTILRRMEQRDTEKALQYDLPESIPEKTRHSADAHQLAAFSREMFRYWTEDEFAASFRRLLTLEQHRSAEMSALYQQYLAAGPLDYVTDLLASLGCSQPRILALELYGPMFLLYSMWDGAADKDAVRTLAHRHFDRMEEILEGGIPS